MFKARYPKEDQISVAGISVDVIRSKRKTMALQIQNGAAVARCPIRASKKELEYFISKHQKWLKEKLSETEQRQNSYPAYQLDNGLKIDLLGKQVELQLGQYAEKPLLDNNVVCLNSNQEIEKQLLPFLRDLSLQTAKQISADYSERMGVSPSQVKVREYKRRWGTCHNKQSITLNWRLVMAPKEIYEYVVVHELAHLIEFNHSKRFWQIVENQIPNWRERRAWLEDHGLSLYRL